MRAHHIARVPRGCLTVRRASPVTCIAVQRMHNSPPRHSISSLLDVSRSSAAPVIGSRFKVADVRDERWTRPTSVLAVRGRAGVVFMAAMVAGQVHSIHVQKSEIRT